MAPTAEVVFTNKSIMTPTNDDSEDDELNRLLDEDDDDDDNAKDGYGKKAIPANLTPRTNSTATATASTLTSATTAAAATTTKMKKGVKTAMCRKNNISSNSSGSSGSDNDQETATDTTSTSASTLAVASPGNTITHQSVDICVTCVSPHPPPLPLRQELPSLGVEVIYDSNSNEKSSTKNNSNNKDEKKKKKNANNTSMAGVGAAVSQLQATQAVQQFREREHVRDLQGKRGTGHSILSSLPPGNAAIEQLLLQHEKARGARHEQIEQELSVPLAISYESYCEENPAIRSLQQTNSHSNCSSGSSNSGSFQASPCGIASELPYYLSPTASNSSSSVGNMTTDETKLLDEFVLPLPGVNYGKKNNRKPQNTIRKRKTTNQKKKNPKKSQWLLQPSSGLTNHSPRSLLNSNIVGDVSTALENVCCGGGSGSHNNQKNSDSNSNWTLSSNDNVLEKIFEAGFGGLEDADPSIYEALKTAEGQNGKDPQQPSMQKTQENFDDLEKRQQQQQNPKAETKANCIDDIEDDKKELPYPSFLDLTQALKSAFSTLGEELFQTFDGQQQEGTKPHKEKKQQVDKESHIDDINIRTASIERSVRRRKISNRYPPSSSSFNPEASAAKIASALEVSNNNKEKKKKPTALTMIAVKELLATLDTVLSDNNKGSGFLSAEQTLTIVTEILAKKPELASIRHPDNDDRLALHVAGARALPDRTAFIASSFVPTTGSATINNNKRNNVGVINTLVSDIRDYSDLLALVFCAHPEAALLLDNHGDLPAHVVARNLLQWEAQWYETIYKQRSVSKTNNNKNDDDDDAVAITKIYQAMSECMELLLAPVLKLKHLCKVPGSVGCILPLHMASIFTVTVPTLSRGLQTYPRGAWQTIDLAQVQTFVPSHSLPLELHDKLSTDFPKWERNSAETRTVTPDTLPPLKWSMAADVGSGEIWDESTTWRRSDLLFAYNPYVLPYRFEKARMRRLEHLICSETRRIIDDETTENKKLVKIKFDAGQQVTTEKACCRLSYATQRVWIWMCTFEESKDKRPTYANSVKRIVGSLSLESVHFLATRTTNEGKHVIHVANPKCASIIDQRLKEGGYAILSSPKDKQQKSEVTAEKQTLEPSQVDLSSEEQEVSQSRHIYPPNRYGEIGFLCRRVFNVEEVSFPTCFVVLPYKLSKNLDSGLIGLASPFSAGIAMKFAEHLLALTEPKSILYFLEMKSIRHHGVSMQSISEKDAGIPSTAFCNNMNSLQESLLTFYERGGGYLYLIDEATGLPLVPDTSKAYPIVIDEPVDIMRELLPLMLIGMVAMRGEKSFQVLIHVLLDRSVKRVPTNWILAAKQLVKHLHSEEAKKSAQSKEVLSLRKELGDFASNPSHQRRLSKKNSGESEWNVELGVLKTLLKLNDTSITFTGQDKGKKSVNHDDGEEISLRALNTKHEQLEQMHTGLLLKSHNDFDNSTSTPMREKNTHETNKTKHLQLNHKNFPQQHQEGVSDNKHDFEPYKDYRWSKGKKDADKGSIDDLNTPSDEEEKRCVSPPLNFPQPNFEASWDTYSDSCQGKYHNVFRKKGKNAVISANKGVLTAKLASANANLAAALTSKGLDTSRYAALLKGIQEAESRDDATDKLRSHENSKSRHEVFCESQRIWEDTSGQLNGMFGQCDDTRVIPIKTGLLEQAEKLSLLNKRVSSIEKVKSGLASVPSTDDSLSRATNYSSPGVTRARKLLFRLCDFEDRVLHNEINMQIFSLESSAIALELEKLDKNGKARVALLGKSLDYGSNNADFHGGALHTVKTWENTEIKSCDEKSYDRINLANTWDGSDTREVFLSNDNTPTNIDIKNIINATSMSPENRIRQDGLLSERRINDEAVATGKPWYGTGFSNKHNGIQKKYYKDVINDDKKDVSSNNLDGPVDAARTWEDSGGRMQGNILDRKMQNASRKATGNGSARQSLQNNWECQRDSPKRYSQGCELDNVDSKNLQCHTKAHAQNANHHPFDESENEHEIEVISIDDCSKPVDWVKHNRESGKIEF